MEYRDLIVVKIGGGAGIHVSEVSSDLASWVGEGRPAIIVHGASERTNQLCQVRGIKPEFLTSPSGHSSRYTTREIRDIFVEAAESINQEILAVFKEGGVSAYGMVGDQSPLQGRRKRALRSLVDGRQIVIRDDYSGHISGVNRNKLEARLSSEHIPVVPPLAYSAEDGFLNVDGDRAAAAIAAALGAERLVILSNVPGLLRDYPDPGSLVTDLQRDELERAMGWAQGRMKRKLLSVRDSIEAGIGEVVLADGRISNPLRQALAGEGTRIRA